MKKKEKEYVTAFAKKGAYCDWILPDSPKSHHIACCHCSLVHEMQFALAGIGKTDKRGRTKLKWAVIPDGEERIIFRAREKVGETKKRRKATGKGPKK